MNAIIREPLIHFFLIGGLLFGWYSLQRDVETDDTIHVTQGQIQSLIQNFNRVWSRPPTQEELEGLIQDYIQEEVMVREAIAIGLDQHDTVIRRRLRQKMEFISDELLSRSEPTESDLREYYQEHKSLFSEPPRISFRHIYFNPERNKEFLDKTKEQLNQNTVDPEVVGDPFLVESSFSMESLHDIKGVFGEEFTDRIFEFSKGEWEGPVASAYGWHLVYIEDGKPGTDIDFESARARVKDRWMLDNSRKLKEAAFEQFRDKYTIEVDRG